MSLGNTATRVIVSIFAIPAIVLVCYLGDLYFIAFVLFIGVISYYEFWAMVKKKNTSAHLSAGILSVAFIVLNSFFNFLEFYSTMLFILLLITLIELFRNSGSAVENLGASLLGILYVGVFASALLSLREFYQEDYIRGGYLIISLFASIWVCDSAAFFGGTATGKHKLFPRVSPNKSWEGAVFGLVFSVITMVIAKIVILDFFSWVDVIVLGVVVGTIGQIGDLIESLFKRDFGVKDSSTIIPGHGGIFDRFDSLLYTSPAVFLYLKYLT